MGPVLITGASGFVGGHLVRKLNALGFPVFAASGAKPSPPSVTAAARESMALDITDGAAVRAALERIRPQAIIHSAAMAQGGECERDPGRAEAVNVGGTEQLLRAAEALPVPLFIYISTDLVFDGNAANEAPFGESSIPHPRSVYSKTKRAAEMLVAQSSLKTVVARISLVYGPALDGALGALGWMVSALLKREPLTLFTNEYRTPVFVDDIGSTVAKLIALHESGTELPKLLHLPGPVRCSRFDFGEALAKQFEADKSLLQPRRREEVSSIPPRPEDTSLLCEQPQMLALPFMELAEGMAAIARSVRR